MFLGTFGTILRIFIHLWAIFMDLSNSWLDHCSISHPVIGSFKMLRPISETICRDPPSSSKRSQKKNIKKISKKYQKKKNFAAVSWRRVRLRFSFLCRFWLVDPAAAFYQVTSAQCAPVARQLVHWPVLHFCRCSRRHFCTLFQHQFRVSIASILVFAVSWCSPQPVTPVQLQSSVGWCSLIGSVTSRKFSRQRQLFIFF